MLVNPKNKAFIPLAMRGDNKCRTKDHKFLIGFTLIELLVVIAVIGLLATIIAASVNSARAKARDAKRIADLRQIYTALQIFYDNNGYLPITTSYGESGPGGWDYSSQDINGNGKYFLEFLEPNYITKVGLDPTNNGTGDVYYGGTGYSYAYFCYPSGWPRPNTFLLGAKLEKDGSVYWYNSNYIPTTCQ